MAERQLQQLVGVLAERLGRSVVLDDPEVNLLAASRHYGDADDQRVRAVLDRDVGGAAIGHILGQDVAHWTSPGFIPPRADLGMKSRLCYPIRWHGQLLGLLLVIDEHRTMTPAEIEEVVRAGHEIGALLVDEQLGQDDLRREQEHALLDVISGDPRARETGARALERLGVLRPAAYVTVTGVELDDRHSGLEATESALALRIATAGAARSRPGFAVGGIAGERGVVVQTWERPPAAERLRAQATELRDGVGRVLGEGPPRSPASAAYGPGSTTRTGRTARPSSPCGRPAGSGACRGSRWPTTSGRWSWCCGCPTPNSPSPWCHRHCSGSASRTPAAGCWRRCAATWTTPGPARPPPRTCTSTGRRCTTASAGSRSSLACPWPTAGTGSSSTSAWRCSTW